MAYRERCLSQKINVCNACGSSGDLLVHHINGDRDDNRLDNLVPLCQDCHANVHGGTGVDGVVKRLQDKLPDSSLRFTDAVGETDRVMLNCAKGVRDELRSFKADHRLTYNEAIIQLLEASDWELQHINQEDSNDGN